MHDFPRQKLCELIDQHGTIIGEDAERCEFFLRNACGGEYKREVFVLVNAIREDVAKELLNPPQGLPIEVVFHHLVQRLHDNLWLDKTAAGWAVQSWSIALGLTITTPIIEENLTLLKENVASQLVSQTIENSQPSTTKAKIPQKSPKRLSPFNPLDHIRLLWWVLVMPQQLQTYRETFGKGDEVRVGNWLVSTLTWGPLLMPALALGLERLPYSSKAWLPEAYLWLSALLVGCWLLTGWLRINKDIAVVMMVFISGVIAGITTGVVVVGMAVDVTISIAIGIAVGIAILISSFVAVIVAGDVAVVVAGVVAVGIAVGVAVGVTVAWAGFMAGFVAGSVAGFVTGFVVDFVADVVGNTIENSLNTSTPFLLARFTFLLLVVIYLFLIGLYLLEWFNQPQWLNLWNI